MTWVASNTNGNQWYKPTTHEGLEVLHKDWKGNQSKYKNYEES